MEGRVKTRQHGSIPKSLGRQVGVMPISGGASLRRASNGDSNMEIPVGGTDMASDPVLTYPAAPTLRQTPPSGSRAGQSRVMRRTSSKGELQEEFTDTNNSRITESSLGKTLGGSRTVAEALMKKYSTAGYDNSGTVDTSRNSALTGRSNTSARGSAVAKTSPPSKTLSGATRTSPASKPLTGITRKSPSSTASAKPKSTRSIASRQLSARSEVNDLDHTDDDEPEGQEVKFFDVPSQRSRPGSHVKQSPNTPEDYHNGENGKKPYKTIDPEEILAQNMESDLNKIYEIGLHASEITHITNMDKFKKLKVLDLSCNFIDRLQNLEANRDLRELKLYDNRLRVIEGLDNLKDLMSLQLQHNKIKSIGKSLSCLKKLKILRIDCNQLLKIEPPELSQCVQLTTLDISCNMLDSLAALNYLPNLEEVNASGNRLRSVSDLSKCKHLGEIDLSGNHIKDLSGLRGLPRLMTLNVSNNQLSSFKTIGKLQSLTDLFAADNHIHDLSSIPGQLPALEVLDLTNNEICDWDQFHQLDEMTELVELFVSGNPFCGQDGPMPHYHTAIQTVLPNLEIIDGAHIKKQVSKGAPLMRPMSASTIVSLRQMDSQMRSADEQMKSLEKSLKEKFAAIRMSCDILLTEPPIPSQPGSGDAASDVPLSSRCSSRSRILEARKFASSVNSQR